MVGKGSPPRSVVIGRRGPIRRALAAHLDSDEVTRVIYGSVIGLALVVALEAHPPTIGQTIGAILGTAIAVGLAEIYSDVIGTEARMRRRPRAGEIRTTTRGAAAVIFGAGFPAIFFVLAGLGAFGGSAAFTLSKWTGLGLIGTYGFVAGRLSGSSVPRAALHAAAVGAIGGVLIALKALLH